MTPTASLRWLLPVVLALACDRPAVVSVAAELVFSSERLDFGAPLLGTTVTRTVDLKNQGSGPLQVSKVSIETLAFASEFSSPDEGVVAWTLKPGETRTVTVTLAPKDDRLDADRLCVDSNDSKNQHACIALTSKVEGIAHLCGCVVDAGVAGPNTPCDLSTQRLSLQTSLGQAVTKAVMFEDCGLGNQVLSIGDRNDLFFTAPAGLKVRALADAALTQHQSFPILLQPPGTDEAMRAVPAKRFYAEVTFTPFSIGPQPSSQLCVSFRGEAGPKTGCLDVDIAPVTCAAGTVDLDRSAANGCECTVAAETCDGADNDCNGLIDDVDADNDRYFACPFWAARDCDDTNASVHPGAAEVCNLRDDNCNSFVDEGVQTDFGQDVDGDGYANPAAQRWACTPPSSVWRPFSQLLGFDCNDTNAAINPAARETCNGADDDCNGLVDDGLPQLEVYLDLDGDGFPAANATRYDACRVPIGYAQRRDVSGDGQFDPDCNDSNITVYPGAPELCDGLLNNCLRSVPDQTCARQCPGQWPVPVSTSSGTVAVAQLDPADNELEVVVTGGANVQVIGHQGQVKWSRAGGNSYSWPSVADVDLNGRLEVVYSSSGTVHVLNGQTGAPMASFAGGTESSYYGTVGAVDLNNDGVVDLVAEGNGTQARALLLGAGLTLASTVRLTVPAAQSMFLAQPFAYDLDGDGLVELGWNTSGWPCTVGTNCQFRAPVLSVDGGAFLDPSTSFVVPFRDTGHGGEGYWPMVADVDGDGVAEVVLPVTNKAGPGSGTWVWRLDGSAHPGFVGAQPLDGRTLAPIDATGAVTMGALRGVGGPAVDLNGDGRFEVITAGSSGLEVHQGGQRLPGYPLGAPGQTPVIADLDLDGTLEVLYVGQADQRVHCLQFGRGTSTGLNVAGMGFQGWSRGSMVTHALDPFEPNDPGNRSVVPSALTRTTAVSTLRAASLAPHQTVFTSGNGWTRELVALLGTQNDRDFYWGDGNGWFRADLRLPAWAPVSYGLRAHFYDGTTGAFAGTVQGAGGTVYCHSAGPPCPTPGAYRVVVEVYPMMPARHFGPWPYRLSTLGTY